MIPSTWLDQAAERVAPYIRKTPLTYDPVLDAFSKWENQQVTGSFKARGAFNKILTLLPWEQERGLVAASAGNHGQGVALAAREVGTRAVIFVPDHATPAKVQAMQALGAEVRFIPGGYGEAEAAGIRFAAETGATWVSPYNDGQVIAGQGTLALEILEQLEGQPAPVWLVPVGGGGLAAGVGLALERSHPRPRLIGVQAEASAFMHALWNRRDQAGVPDLPTLADGLAGWVEETSVTIPMMHHYLDDLLLVSEEEIGRAVAYAWQQYRARIEGSAAVGLAALLSGKIESKPRVIIFSGGNIQPEVHAELCQRFRGPGG